MDFEKYEKYMDARAAVRKENERRIAEKFSECEKYVADNFVCCGCVEPMSILWTKKVERL